MTMDFHLMAMTARRQSLVWNYRQMCIYRKKRDRMARRPR